MKPHQFSKPHQVKFQTRRFDNIDSVVNTVSFQFCTALLTLLVMTAESILLNRLVLRINVVSCFFLNLFSSHIYCNR